MSISSSSLFTPGMPIGLRHFEFKMLLYKKVESVFLSTKGHIILTASSGVSDKLRTGSQPIPSKLTDKIGEQATPTDPGK
jgi:hypothetical protein